MTAQGDRGPVRPVRTGNLFSRRVRTSTLEGMNHDFSLEALDIRALIQTEASLAGPLPLAAFGRVTADVQGTEAGGEIHGDVDWQAQGRVVPVAGAADELWLDLVVDAEIPQICQRCLKPMRSALHIERSFRFVADEQTAAALDEESEDDVLVISRQFDLHALIEDELLMGAPLVPRHDTCPQNIAWTLSLIHI